MAKLSSDEVKARIEHTFLLASTILKSYETLKNTPNALLVSEAKSPLNLGLKSMLGKALIDLLIRDNEQIQCYRLSGLKEKGIEEHVIPLGVLIDYLIENPEYGDSPTLLREFFRNNLIVAYVPKEFDKQQLNGGIKYKMPKTYEKNSWIAIDETHAKDSKRLDAAWSRYQNTVFNGRAVVRPGLPNSSFDKCSV